MRHAGHWTFEFMNICASDPCVHGQMLPATHVEQFVKRIQIEALRWAIDEIITRGDPSLGYEAILEKIESLKI